MELTPDVIAYIITIALGLLSTFLGFRYRKVKTALKESKEAVVTIVDALEDDKIDSDETAAIVKEAKEAAKAWGAVFKKE
jgi:hypothetical protein